MSVNVKDCAINGVLYGAFLSMVNMLLSASMLSGMGVQMALEPMAAGRYWLNLSIGFFVLFLIYENWFKKQSAKSK